MEALFFSAGGNVYLAPLASLAEVLMPAALRPLPAAPGFLLGILHLRGAAVPVVDLRERLGLPPRSGFERGNRILRVAVAGRDLGLVVDEVLRIEVLDPAARREATLGIGGGRRGQGPLWQVDGELIQEMRLDRLLDAAELELLGLAPSDGRSDPDRLLRQTPADAETTGDGGATP